MEYKVYLFDFDYTLADSSRGIVTCFRHVLDRHGYTSPTDDDIKRTIGKTLEWQDVGRVFFSIDWRDGCCLPGRISS